MNNIWGNDSQDLAKIYFKGYRLAMDMVIVRCVWLHFIFQKFNFEIWLRLSFWQACTQYNCQCRVWSSECPNGFQQFLLLQKIICSASKPNVYLTNNRSNDAREGQMTVSNYNCWTGFHYFYPQNTVIDLIF